MRHDLVDEYLLLVHPLVLGSGRRLFADGGPPASLRLVDSTVKHHGRPDRHLPAEPGVALDHFTRAV
jgi:dihydrofolate reductase